MNDLERFKAVARFDATDYTPIFGFPGAPGMSRGCMKFTRDRLFATGMPESVGGAGIRTDVESWYQYWGTTGPIVLDFSIARGAPGIKSTKRIENGYEVIESEAGAVTRQVLDNNQTYSMPDFVRYPVRDRESWELYKRLTTPTDIMPADEMEAHCRRFDNRDMPLTIGAGSTYGRIRSLMGVEAASMALYDDPELIQDMISVQRERFKIYVAPLIERLQPEIVTAWEDIGYNVGLLISPEHFRQFCTPFYRDVAEVNASAGVTVAAVDSDGCAMELVPLIAECGFNALCPFEAKGGNDLPALREEYPEFIFFGWLEKEVVNEGNENLIEQEIMEKVPGLLERGRYFPNGDHGIQPLVTFPNLCKFMTLLHEVCGNPEGDFPRC